MPQNKKKHHVDQWHNSALLRALPILPFTHEEQRQFLKQHEDFYEAFFNLYSRMPKWERFSFHKDVAFQDRLEMYLRTNEATQSRSFLTLGRAMWWKDMLSMSAYFNRLFKEKGMRILNNYLRCSNLKDIIGMALASRALLELGISAASTQKNVIAKFEEAYNKLKNYDDPQKVIFDVAGLTQIEQTIVHGIWGTRMYSGNLGDENEKKGKTGTSIWKDMIIPNEIMAAKNIMTLIKGRAKRMEDKLGLFDYRIYEILCDVVHPAALGYDLLREEQVDDNGEFTVTVTTEKNNAYLADIIVGAATWGACHGTGLIVEIADRFEKIAPTLISWADKRVENDKSELFGIKETFH